MSDREPHDINNGPAELITVLTGDGDAMKINTSYLVQIGIWNELHRIRLALEGAEVEE